MSSNKEIARILTDNELIYLTDFLIIDPEKDWEVSIAVLENNRNDIINQVKNLKIYPSKLDILKSKIIFEYHKSKIHPGSALGVDSALSIGAPTTQLTLNSFHSAGLTSANVTSGVPRFNELLNASKHQKCNVLKIKLIDKYKKESFSKIRELALCTFESKYIDQIQLKESVNDLDIVQERFNKLSIEDKIWYENFDIIYTDSYKEYEWSVRLKFDKLMMYQYKLSMFKISKIIENKYKDCRCVFSSDNLAIIDIYIDTSNIDDPEDIIKLKKKTKSKKKKHQDDECTHKEDRPLITNENKEYYFIRLSIDYILDIKLSGIDGINKLFYKKETFKNEWMIETEGTNMREVMNIKDVDFKYVISNNMWEIYGILGIEAARSFLIQEITSIISFGGTLVDLSHITLLSDSMTYTGTISSVNRYGIGKGVAGPLTTASFEQSHQNMLNAPAKGIVDDLKTVSAAIIMGKHIEVGSGMMKMVTNVKMLKENLNNFNNNIFKGEVRESTIDF